jgi:hypothetical protein
VRNDRDVVVANSGNKWCIAIIVLLINRNSCIKEDIDRFNIIAIDRCFENSFVLPDVCTTFYELPEYGWLASAPLERSKAAISGWLSRTAVPRGVYVPCFFSLGSTPMSSKIFTDSIEL